MTTLHASSAAATAAYYAHYLAAAPGEAPGEWAGRQAHDLGLSGPVMADALESLLSGHDPVTGSLLGRELLDRFTSDGQGGVGVRCDVLGTEVVVGVVGAVGR
ncbi:MAG: relaxase domain-containing protein [Acidimicrobiia bacterium]|nr:relaxase domain-containing protein [Acidimicrobiia bacterium]